MKSIAAPRNILRFWRKHRVLESVAQAPISQEPLLSPLQQWESMRERHDETLLDVLGPWKARHDGVLLDVLGPWKERHDGTVLDALGQWRKSHEGYDSVDIIFSWKRPQQSEDDANVLAMWGERRTMALDKGQWVVTSTTLTVKPVED